ncbi:glutamine--fructose-6-phosphate transaminase (isomerizing) [Aequorivita vladivostokensis]|uniref:Glutamine--fructose-6-phosphate aminotransferase [isomerizing] n=1 Tax=Aequorivita vladivostokensis TaxID=171194 RepID=A0ABR5DG22_9FLAO|nr:glutamine--fructose-6-phosphate transaminase (isomerizing) [Aequorivita vladivostokensis]MAB57159.1 glutamine--fructose-6-phosphate transaminase (isomerizing) [Aequorivita sp.]KJJ37706.1 glutamine amidotransferase [Aequorivita vladivostokensis]MBF31641.1 glutamine--fructose-6-phosphate transaminase (isomerizing) [Aequorivita sp.]HAV53385.1 glutamine--fructose-6-phosphate transaminase (isomerizing) [Aequorivita sp.]HBL80275.1 glutamine--fructose-6-phosphate transaminase (isomerizing) [Aequor|tara:strand:+ start:92526 stop:94373 length:1848 start_codon:yes stop_codon:yes gene_type:complete
MCGIVGYIGKREAYPIILNGLKRLEYRGYDSAGIALFDGTDIQLCKTKGKVADLEAKAGREITLKGNLGIGHTRWATHGVPNDVNSHPHYSNSGDLVIIHNGIIENYDSLKKELKKRGYTFTSDTDTEVLVNLIEDIQINEKVKLGKAVQIALNQVVGAYAIALFDRKKPDEIVVAKLGSPLAIGIGEDEFFVASDASPFIEFTNNAIYLEDEEMAIIRLGRDVKVRKIKGDKLVAPYVQELQLNLEQIEKGGYDHFMLKEIHEQPAVIKDTYRGRLLAEKGIVRLGGLEDYIEKFINADRIVIVACGTSWHAGLVAEYIFEDLVRIPVEVEYASEFRYRNPIISENDVVIAISQSGETADTLAAIKLAKSKGAFVYGICNVVGSTISRETHSGTYTHAGPEIGVASTKAFTTQITVLAMIALRLAKAKGTISQTDFMLYLRELELIPNHVDEALKTEDKIKEISAVFKDARNFLYLGRGYNFPVALEGALKLKEISYIHAEGYPAAEMKHGPIALIDEHMPVVVIAIKSDHYDKVVSNIQEIKARKGKIIAVVSEGDTAVREMADYVMEVPHTPEALSPLVTTIPLQLLSYHIAVMLGRNVDQPRNLAKSVTVE